MATRKKKASPAQLAARARFAAAAKAGTLRKGAKLKKNPVKKSALRTTPARKKNPSRAQRNAGARVVRSRASNPLPIIMVGPTTLTPLAHFKTVAQAKKVAQAYADSTGKQVRIKKG